MQKSLWKPLGTLAVLLTFLTGFQGLALAEEGEKAARVVVPKIQVSGVDENAADLLTDILLDVLFNRHGITALGPSEIQQMLSVEAQKQLLGCNDSDCLAEIGGALEARYLISGRIGKLGSQNLLTLLLVDTQKSELAGRATTKLAKLEDAIDAVGPLTDKLLGRTFRAARASEIAAFRNREETRPDYEPMDVRGFCKKFQRYTEALEKTAYDPALVKTREELLYDIVLTPHQPRYAEKVSCAKGSDLFYVVPRIAGLLRGARDEATALDVRQRIAETRKMIDQLEVVESDYTMGLEKVKLNTGTLPTKLSFKVKPAKVVLPEESAEVKAYRKAYANGEKLVARVLKLTKSGTQEQFDKLWIPAVEGKSRNTAYPFDRIVTAEKNGHLHTLCPWFTLPVREVEGNAQLLAEKQQLKACYRKYDAKGEDASFSWVTLEKVGSKWKIARF